MGNSIFISNNRIQAMSLKKNGHVKVNQYVSAELSGRSMINGVITNVQELVTQLQALQQRNPALFKDATLTIDAGSLVTRKIQAPQLNKPQYDKLVQEELADQTAAYEDMLYDYTFLTKGKKGGSMLACAVNTPFIETYIQVFEQAGIKLAAIHVGLETLISFVSGNKEMNKGVIALNVLDGINMLSMIFENGEYIFSTRTRLLGETEEEYAASIAQSLSSLTQFNKNISQVFYIGASDRLLSLIKNQIMMVELPLINYDLLKKAGSSIAVSEACHFAYLEGFADAKCMDLLRLYQSKNKKQRKPLNKLYLIPAVFAALVVLATIGLRVGVALDNKEIKEINAYLESEIVKTKIAEIAAIEKQQAEYEGFYKLFDEAEKSFAEYPLFTQEDYKALYDNAQGKVTIGAVKFDSAKKTVAVSAQAASEFESANYIARLSGNEKFKNITYTGYSQSSQGAYGFSFTILLPAE